MENDCTDSKQGIIHSEVPKCMLSGSPTNGTILQVASATSKHKEVERNIREVQYSSTCLSQDATIRGKASFKSSVWWGRNCSLQMVCGPVRDGSQSG